MKYRRFAVSATSRGIRNLVNRINRMERRFQNLLRSNVFLAVAVLISACQSDNRPPPNILLVLVDDMGWSDIGPYGGEIETPQLDELAANGLRFTQFHTTSKCHPSRASLLTGLYPQQIGMDTGTVADYGSVTTIAAALGRSGYKTYMVGKHHATDHPMDLGFDRYVGLRDGASNHFNPGTVARFGEAEPARKPRSARIGRMWCFDRDCVQGYTPEDPDFYSTDFYTDQAISFLGEATQGEQPFFLYLAYQAPHDPLQAWPEDIGKYLETYSSGYAPIAEARYVRMLELGLIDDSFPRAQPVFEDWNSLSGTEREDATRRMAVYAAMTDRVDQGLARIVGSLRESGYLDNTIIVFTSDNGASAERVTRPGSDEEIGSDNAIGTVGRWASLGGDWANVSNTPYRFFKNYSYEGGAATPLILHWPAGIKDPGRIISANTNLIDLFPTLLSAAGNTELPLQLEGIDLGHYLVASTPVQRSKPVFQRWRHGRSARTDRWKLMSEAEPGQAPEDGAWKLFDMAVDKTETTDVAKEHPEVVASLASKYDAWLARVKPEDD